MTYREISITAYLTTKRANAVVKDLIHGLAVDQVEIISIVAEADGLKSLLPIISGNQRKLVLRACNAVGRLMLYTK